MKLENPFLNIKNKEKPDNYERKTYSLESGIVVDVISKKIEPKNNDNIKLDQNIVFFSGWETGPGDMTTLKLGETFSSISNESTYVINTDYRNVKQELDNNDLLYEEAKAISKYIKENGLRNIKIVGYSIGGNRAVDVVSILQKDPEINIQGLILLSSVGLYNQKPIDLAKNLLKDSFVSTPKNLINSNDSYSNFKKWFNVAVDVNLNTVKNIISSPSHIGRLKGAIEKISTVNPRLSELKVPIVLVNGEDDLVSDVDKIIPPEEQNKDINSQEKFLKDNLFKNSPYVRMINPSKKSNHGLAYYRSESVAKTSLYLIDKFNKHEN